MKILFYTPSFYPRIGGLEHVAQMLAESLSKKGLSVKLITLTSLANHEELASNFEITRNPSRLHFFKLYRQCDIFFHHNVSLKGIWPLFIFPKKWVVLHHLTYFDIHGRLSTLEWIKRKLSLLADNVSVSNYVNDTLPKKGEVIYNPYNEDIFYRKPSILKKKDLLFVGRLVSDKGCLLLLQAINLLVKEGVLKKLTVVGDGPEMVNLKNYCLNENISHLVDFLGARTGNDLADIYNEHQQLIVPSIWKEPFGIVVLEGMACGCEVIISDGDGLIEASLGMGKPFKKGNVNSLKETLLDNKHNLIASLNPPKELAYCQQDFIISKWVAYLKKVYEN